MNCDTIAGWQTLLRAAFRIVDASTGTFKVEETGAGVYPECETPVPSVLTLLAMASDGDHLSSHSVSGGTLAEMDCIYPGDAMIMHEVLVGGVLHLYVTESEAVMTCDETSISTADMIRAAAVKVDGLWRLRAVENDGDPMTCDEANIGIETMIRMAMVPLGDGTFALRVSY